ncbi:MAG: symmetrical bis(5'-nucleosyl)-tetraphosphatase [Polyangiaceae bacterium]|nr:symmetrical bis(5'-nucleosyl)-tetraphosphatase [Polyangiaceae bacterium]
MATFVIGDVQGCYDPLARLLTQVGFDETVDRLWLVGDLVNRGPHSLEVMKLLRSIAKACTVTLGNHDLHALAVFYRTTKAKATDTLGALLAAPDAHEHFDWLRHCALFHTDESLGYSMVHAGVLPDWDIHTAGLRAREVEAALQSSSPESFLRDMYGNEPARFDDSLRGNSRLRVITNVLTRMRFCRTDGTLDLKSKGPLSETPVGYLPWFSHTQRKTADNRIFFGHWAHLLGETHVPNAIATDTACVWGECLTAIRIEDGKRFQAPCPPRASNSR